MGFCVYKFQGSFLSFYWHISHLKMRIQKPVLKKLSTCFDESSWVVAFFPSSRNISPLYQVILIAVTVTWGLLGHSILAFTKRSALLIMNC